MVSIRIVSQLFVNGIQRILTKCSDYSGATQLDDPFTQPVITADHVRADTPTDEEDFVPETEGEAEADESEVDENGRYTKRAKAKHRA
jgi:hypothetical protein